MDKLCDGAAHGRVVPFAILLNLPRWSRPRWCGRDGC